MLQLNKKEMPSRLEFAKLSRFLNDTWTVQDLTRIFRVRHMTIHNWRRNRGLRALVIKGDGRPSIRFIKTDVRTWAKKHAISMYPNEEDED